MVQRFFSFLSMAVLGCGLLLLASPGAWAQAHGGYGGGQQPGGLNQPGTGPNGIVGAQNSAEATFVATMRRNSEVETDLSKLALKNSSNDDVKKLAKQVIQENRRDEIALTGASENANPGGTTPTFAAPVPSQTRKAEKQMKKLAGTQFDEMYISQMNGYVKNDQKMVSDASSSENSADMQSLVIQLRNTADQRSQEIAHVAQGENFKIQ